MKMNIGKSILIKLLFLVAVVEFSIMLLYEFFTPLSVLTEKYVLLGPVLDTVLLIFIITFAYFRMLKRPMDELLKVGDTVRIQGPLGAFTLTPAKPKDYVFVGTGTGIAPFRAHLKWALEEAADTRPMHLFFGVRQEEDLFWVEELRNLAQRFPNFHAHISVSRPGDSWTGLKGRVTDIIPTVITDFTRVSAYVCGNPDMVKDVKAWFLGKGVPKEDLHQEGYV